MLAETATQGPAALVALAVKVREQARATRATRQRGVLVRQPRNMERATLLAAAVEAVLLLLAV
jgi:hypothetical protein